MIYPYNLKIWMFKRIEVYFLLYGNKVHYCKKQKKTKNKFKIHEITFFSVLPPPSPPPYTTPSSFSFSSSSPSSSFLSWTVILFFFQVKMDSGSDSMGDLPLAIIKNKLEREIEEQDSTFNDSDKDPDYVQSKVKKTRSRKKKLNWRK